MNPIFITAVLTVTLTTNEVKLGTAIIGPKTFDVVGLQVVTNRIVQRSTVSLNVPIQDATPLLGESWTNTYPGPFVATNLVPCEIGQVNINTNFIWWNDMKIVLTNYIAATNIDYRLYP